MRPVVAKRTIVAMPWIEERAHLRGVGGGAAQHLAESVGRSQRGASRQSLAKAGLRGMIVGGGGPLIHKDVGKSLVGAQEVVGIDFVRGRVDVLRMHIEEFGTQRYWVDVPLPECVPGQRADV